MVRAGVFLALAAGAVAVSASQGHQTVFRSGVDLVTFGVTVVDAKNNVIGGLTAEDFELYEDGKKQALRYFAAGDHDGSGPAGELHLGVVFDISGSMEEDLAFARNAAVKFLGKLARAQDYTLVDFDTEIRVARFSQAEFPRLVERIRTRRTSDAYTALWDATGVYLDGASGQEGRKVLVLYTDGADNSSNITFSELRDLVKASDVTIHAIGFLQHVPSSFKLEGRYLMQQLAELTGGQAFFPTSLKDLDSVYDRVAAEIAGQYSLGYVSTNAKADGTWRKVEIKLLRPDLKGARLRTRAGYYAPLKDDRGR